jgi:hypothetical protein
MAYQTTAIEKQACFAFGLHCLQKCLHARRPLAGRALGLAFSLVLAALSAGLLALPAQARPFPAQAKTAQFAITDYPNITLDDKARTLSAAAKIRNADNLIVMPLTLGTATYLVKYTEDMAGQIDRIWILSAAEASQLDAD